MLRVIGVSDIDNLPGNIFLLGSKKHAEIPKWMKLSDVLVLPNSGKQDISKLYTSPIKMFEYMASGVIIVASDLPSIREVLNEKNSILVEPDKVKSLVGGIDRALNDENTILTDKALRDVKAYDWSERASNILNFIK